MSILYWQPELNDDPCNPKLVVRLRDYDDPNDAAMIFLSLRSVQDVDPASALVIIDPARTDLDRLFDRLRLGFVGFHDPLVRPLCEAAAFELLRNRPHIVLFDDLSATECGAMVYGYAKDPSRPGREIAHWRDNARASNSQFAPFLPEDVH